MIRMTANHVSTPATHAFYRVATKEEVLRSDLKENKQLPPHNNFADTYGALSPHKGWKKHKSANLKVLQGFFTSGMIKAIIPMPLETLWEQGEAS